MLSTVMPKSLVALKSSIDFWIAAPVSPNQGCQNVRVKPYKSDLFTSRDEVGWGVIVAVGVRVIPGLVGVGVDSCVSVKTSGVGVGWPLQAASSAMERIMITRYVGLAGAIIPNEVR